MSITLRPYIKDKTRYHVDMQIEHPTTQKPLRKRIVAPAGLDERQAQRWGEKELEKWLRTFALQGPRQENADKAPAQNALTTKCELTLDGFYRERFEPSYVRFQRPATQTSYETVWPNHLSSLGSMPLCALDAETIDQLKTDLADKQLGATTINLVLKKIAKMLRWALHRRLIAGVPLIELLKVTKQPRPHYAGEQLDELRLALAKLPPEDVIVFILAFECGMRTGEIAALRWTDVNLARGSSRSRAPSTEGTRGRARTRSRPWASPRRWRTRSTASNGGALGCGTVVRSTLSGSGPSTRSAANWRLVARRCRAVAIEGARGLARQPLLGLVDVPLRRVQPGVASERLHRIDILALVGEVRDPAVSQDVKTREVDFDEALQMERGPSPLGGASCRSFGNRLAMLDLQSLVASAAAGRRK